MVCRSINSICPIHGFLLSHSVQATGGGSCWAVLPGLISKGYKLHYPAQSEPAPSGSAPSIHPLFFCLPLFFSPNAASCADLHLSFHPPSLSPFSFRVGDWWGLSLEPFRYPSIETRIEAKQPQTHTVNARSESQTHINTHTNSRTRARQKQQREPHRFNRKTSYSVWVRRH